MREYRVLLWLLRKIRRRIPMMLCMVVSNAGSALLGVLFALGSRGVIDSAIARDKAVFFEACLVQAAIIFAMVFFLALSKYLKDRLLTDLDRDWKRQLFGDLLRGEYAQVSAYHSGELVNRLNGDVRLLNDAVVGILPGAVSMLVRLLSAVAVLAAMNVQFTLSLLTGGILVVIATGIARRNLKNLNKKVSRAEGTVLSYLQEAIERLLIIQAMDLAAEVDNRAEVLLEERYKIQRHRRRISLATNTLLSVFYQIAGFGALVWGAFHLLHGTMSYGSLMVVTQLVGQMQAPFVHLSGIIPQYAAMIAAAERLMELGEIEQESSNGLEDPKKYYRQMESIGARDMSFSYGEEEVFHNASFTLPKGSFVTITGPSGIGKSTLLKLMLGVFKPTDGILYVKLGQDEMPLSRNTRGLFAYVPQGNFLFSGTLRDNILIGNPEASREEIEQAVHISAMDQYLSQLPDGLDSLIGENGAGLSEGQVQRLAIARAILSGAPILLLDEATSALDIETEQVVLGRIARLPERTCIVVTHRPGALRLADWKLEVADKTITVRKDEVKMLEREEM